MFTHTQIWGKSHQNFALFHTSFNLTKKNTIKTKLKAYLSKHKKMFQHLAFIASSLTLANNELTKEIQQKRKSTIDLDH